MACSKGKLQCMANDGKVVVPGRVARLQLSLIAEQYMYKHIFAAKDSFVFLPTGVGNCHFARLDSSTRLRVCLNIFCNSLGLFSVC